jgi:hypothetical protein
MSASSDDIVAVLIDFGSSVVYGDTMPMISVGYGFDEVATGSLLLWLAWLRLSQHKVTLNLQTSPELHLLNDSVMRSVSYSLF